MLRDVAGCCVILRVDNELRVVMVLYDTYTRSYTFPSSVQYGSSNAVREIAQQSKGKGLNPGPFTSPSFFPPNCSVHSFMEMYILLEFFPLPMVVYYLSKISKREYRDSAGVK
jgi:hypothetical protein